MKDPFSTTFMQEFFLVIAITTINLPEITVVAAKQGVAILLPIILLALTNRMDHLKIVLDDLKLSRRYPEMPYCAST